MSNFSNAKRIPFSFSKSRINTSHNVKNNQSVFFATNLANDSNYQPNTLNSQTTDSMGLYTYWSNYSKPSDPNDNFFKDIQIEEHDINLNSVDRDISVNSNPLNFTVWLNPGSTRSKSFLPRVFKNVKYISFEHIIFPKYNKLNMFDGSADLSANIFISDISNSINTIVIDDNIISTIDSNISYQICNLTSDEISVCVNFTINFNKEISWELIYCKKTHNKILNKYLPILTSGLSNYIQHICIQPTNNKFLFNTKNI